MSRRAGRLHGYTPEVGHFTGECTTGGHVVLDQEAPLAILDAAPDLATAYAELHRTFGGPWTEDWEAASSARQAEADTNWV
jgi:hypothetical protein